MEDGVDYKERKTWTELKQISCDLRRQFSAVSTVVPSLIKFRNLPDGTTRIFFLGTQANGWESTLHYADVPTRESKNTRKLQWQQLLDFNFHKASLNGKHSREEQLMLERKRLTTWGIASYELHPESGKIVFPAASTLYQCVDNTYRNGPLFPSEVRMNTNGAKLAPEICPSNPDLLAFVCNCDIWIAHELSGKSQRVTYAHKGGRSLSEDPLSAGIPSYVIQEEFLRYEGFWWQPQSNDGIYRLLYEELDESEVSLYTFPSFTSPTSGEVEQHRYPRAGSTNSKSNIKLLELTVGDNGVENIRTLELRCPLSQLFQWAEYLVRVGWTPDSQHIWLELLDRRQKRLELVMIGIENFVEPLPNVYNLEEAPTPIAQVLAKQTSEIWINVNDLLYFLPKMKGGNEVTFIWGSEESGFRHLYLITAYPSTCTNGLDSTLDGNESKCRVREIALTSGEWEVLGSKLWVNKDRKLIYFIGLKDTPLEKHLYVVSLDHPGEVRLLTCPGFSYSVNMNQDCSVCVAVYSNIQKLPVCEVFRITHTDSTVDGVRFTPVGFLLESQAPESPLHSPEIHRYRISSGEDLYAMVFRPHGMKEGKKYPTVLNIYGGPEVQLVSNCFEGMKHLRMHILASEGYCVISIDSRGSQHRGIAFESHIRHRMGTVELIDQIEVLRMMASELKFIDLDRVGILGWSYGGYLSLMALARYPEVFKVAIAGAPVTSWDLYDTGYTERYMDLPENNPQGYSEGSILSYVHQFPDEENRLLVVHGLIDDNVHFSHTNILIHQMIRKEKPYQLQVYPNERHSLRSLDASKHYETMVLCFLQNNL